MIVTKLIGGLGNQMFQYAIGRSLANINQDDFKLDISGFNVYKLHKYSLNNFNIKEKIASKSEIDNFKKYKRRNRKLSFLYNFMFADKKKYIEEKQFNFDENILKLKGSFYLDGYWQTEKYFKNIENLIRNDFTAKEELSDNSKKLEKEILSKKAISVHVRRGDYISNPETLKFHGICDENYYKEAEKIIETKIKDCHFFVFSDDHEWAKENIKFKYPTTYVDNGPDRNYEDIVLMSKCKHNIIANSSFSWWGAWLNNNPQKIVIAPKKWFKDTSINTEDITPKKWIRL